MKKNLILLGTAVTCMFAGAVAANTPVRSIPVYADDSETTVVDPEVPEDTEPETPVYTCSVVLGTVEHATVKTDITEGNVGDLCTVTVNHDLFYIVNTVTVNDTSLVESETTSGVYTFSLVEGVNTVNVKCVVDEEALGELSKIYDEAANKDWTSLFTWENVIAIIKWVIDGGFLLVLIRYFVKDKKTAKTIEENIPKALEKILPDMVKQTVEANTEAVIKPMFNQIVADGVETKKIYSTFARCFALGQQGTPEAKAAIIEELSNLGISDSTTLAEIKSYIEKMVNDNMAAYKETMAALNDVIAQNKANIVENKTEETNVEETVKAIEEQPETVAEDNGDNGTQI